MGYYNGNANQITINTRGTAESRFTRASFTASISRTGPSGPAAKEAARPIIDALKAAIVAAGEGAGIDLERMSTTFAVAPYTEYENGRQVPRGYQATYTIAFSCVNMVEALRVHDQITSIEGVVSPTPVFHMDNQGEVADAAFKDAYEKAVKKLEGQCEAVGEVPSDWRLSSWVIEDEEPRGKMLSFKEGAGKASAAGGEPGKALFDVNVRFLYERSESWGRKQGGGSDTVPC